MGEQTGKTKKGNKTKMSRFDSQCSSEDVNKEDECVPSSSEDSQGNEIVTEPSLCLLVCHVNLDTGIPSGGRSFRKMAPSSPA